MSKRGSKRYRPRGTSPRSGSHEDKYAGKTSDTVDETAVPEGEFHSYTPATRKLSFTTRNTNMPRRKLRRGIVPCKDLLSLYFFDQFPERFFTTLAVFLGAV